MPESQGAPKSNEEPDRRDEFSSPHILIADDDREIVRALQEILIDQGYQVTTVSDGNQAIAIAEAKSPDLIMLDVMLPRRSGFLVLEYLRQNLDVPIPVVIITGNTGQRHRAYAEMLGVSGYFIKPVKFPELLKTVSQLLTVGNDV